jgi:hypothetical protein
MIGRASEAIADATHQNAMSDATGQQRGIGTDTVTRGVQGARGPRGTVRDIEMATAGEEGGTHGRLKTESHTDGGEDARALRKPTVVTKRHRK